MLNLHKIPRLLTLKLGWHKVRRQLSSGLEHAMKMEEIRL